MIAFGQELLLASDCSVQPRWMVSKFALTCARQPSLEERTPTCQFSRDGLDVVYPTTHAGHDVKRPGPVGSAKSLATLMEYTVGIVSSAFQVHTIRESERHISTLRRDRHALICGT